jgi:AcrR family transcriptional regulator
MKKTSDADRTIPEGRRARKKEETRQRIANAAKELFLKHGFAATTIEEIAAAADISKRSFFDYFPAKEDVVLAWHEEFQSAFIANLLKRPASEASIVAVQEALIETLGKYDLDDVRTHAILWKETAIRARDHIKYERLERALTDALLQRSRGRPNELRARLVAMLIVGALRVAGEIYLTHHQSEKPAAGVRRITRLLRDEIDKLGDGD